MHRFINADSGFFRFMGRVADLMILNVIFLLTSLPIVTLGASLTALSSSTLRLARGEESYLWKMYLKAWKENFKQSTLLFLFMAALGAFLLFDIQLTAGQYAGLLPMSPYLRYLFLFLGFLYLGSSVYLYPLLAQFENTLLRSLKNSLLMAVSRFPYTAAMTAILAAPFALVWFFPLSIPYVILFFLLMGFAVISRFHAFFLLKALRPFLPEEEAQEE